jgi:hypothetical protein
MVKLLEERTIIKEKSSCRGKIKEETYRYKE